MSSWGPGYVQKRGHMLLPYHHFVGMSDYANEFFKLILSVFYAHQSNEFLFLFDKVNSVSTNIGLFEFTLKKNNYIRFLSYYPSQGFNIAERRDLLEPVIQRGHGIDKQSFFALFSQVFTLQDKIKQHIINLYNRYDVSLFDADKVGLCLQENATNFSHEIAKVAQFASRPGDSVSVFLSTSSRDQYKVFQSQCPTNWKCTSMWDTIPPVIQTEEQKIDALASFLGSLVALENCRHLIGSFHHPSFRFLYCKDAKYRTPSNITVLDGSSFSHF